MLGGQRLFHRAGKAAGDGAAIEAQCAALRQLLRQKRGDGGHVGLAHAHQLDAAARQLIRRLQEVAAVGPEARFILGNNGGSGRTGKACDIRSCFKVSSYIFRFMVIGGRNQISVHAVGSHFFAESS